MNASSDDLLGKQSAIETLTDQQLEGSSIHLLANNKTGKAPNFSSDLDKSKEAITMDSQVCKSSSLSEAFPAQGNSKVTELDSKKLLADKTLIETNQDGSTSILGKLFGSALTPNGGDSGNFIEVLF